MTVIQYEVNRFRGEQPIKFHRVFIFYTRQDQPYVEAIEKGKQGKARDVLCPVALDDAWKRCDWPGVLRRQIEDYNVLDFSGWKKDEHLAEQFA